VLPTRYKHTDFKKERRSLASSTSATETAQPSSFFIGTSNVKDTPHIGKWPPAAKGEAKLGGIRGERKERRKKNLSHASSKSGISGV